MRTSKHLNLCATRDCYHGFTLVELLVVMAVISLLAAMLLPVLKQAREAAQAGNCLSNLKQVGLTFEQYLNNNDRKFHGPFQGPLYTFETPTWVNMLLTTIAPGNPYQRWKHIINAKGADANCPWGDTPEDGFANYKRYSAIAGIFLCPAAPIMRMRVPASWMGPGGIEAEATTYGAVQATWGYYATQISGTWPGDTWNVGWYNCPLDFNRIRKASASVVTAEHEYHLWPCHDGNGLLAHRLPPGPNWAANTRWSHNSRNHLLFFDWHAKGEIIMPYSFANITAYSNFVNN